MINTQLSNASIGRLAALQTNGEIFEQLEKLRGEVETLETQNRFARDFGNCEPHAFWLIYENERRIRRARFEYLALSGAEMAL